MGYLTVSLNLNVSLKVLRVNMHHNQLQLVKASHHTLGGTPAAKLALVPPEQHPWGAPGPPQLQAPKWVYTKALIWGVGIYRVYTGIYYTGYIPGPYTAQP